MNDEVTNEQAFQATSEQAEAELVPDSEEVFADQLGSGSVDEIQAGTGIVPDGEKALTEQPGSASVDDIQAETEMVPDCEEVLTEQPGSGTVDEKALEPNSERRAKQQGAKVWSDRSKQIATVFVTVPFKKAVEVFQEASPFAKSFADKMPHKWSGSIEVVEKTLIQFEDTHKRNRAAEHLRQVSSAAPEDEGGGLWNGAIRLGIRLGFLSSRSDDGMLTLSMDQVLAAFECLEDREESVFSKVAQGKLPLRRVFARMIGAALCLAVVVLVCHAILTAITCAATRYLAFDETGMLIDPAHPPDNAAAASKVVVQPLAVLQSLSPFGLQQLAMLRQVEDITFFHQNLFHMLRVSSVALTAVGQLTLKSADGSSLRIEPGGQAYFFSPVKGNEVRLLDQLLNFQSAGTSMYQQPSSSFQKELLTSA